MESITPVYKSEKLIVVRCEDLFYPDYKGKFFVLEKTNLYGFFYPINKNYTEGELLDEFKIKL